MADQGVGAGGTNAHGWTQLAGQQAFDCRGAADIAGADGKDGERVF
jgi:hypothetical protein